MTLFDALALFSFVSALLLFFLLGFVAGAASVHKTIRHAVDGVTDTIRNIFERVGL